jgi:hypothetical protein
MKIWARLRMFPFFLWVTNRIDMVKAEKPLIDIGDLLPRRPYLTNHGTAHVTAAIHVEKSMINASFVRVKNKKPLVLKVSGRTSPKTFGSGLKNAGKKITSNSRLARSGP